VFLFGILSSPLPYLIMAAFYFFGFVTGMFQKEVLEDDKNAEIQVSTIHVEPPSKQTVKAENNFHFHHYKSEKKVVDSSKHITQSLPYSSKEKLIYFVHDIKIPSTTFPDYSFCRPPPSIS